METFSLNGDLNFSDFLCLDFYNDEFPNAQVYGKHHIFIGINFVTNANNIILAGPNNFTLAILAHEFAHIIQKRLHVNFIGMNQIHITKKIELQADCMAGAILSYFKNIGQDNINEFGKILYSLGGHLYSDHGTGGERLSFFYSGARAYSNISITNQFISGRSLLNLCNPDII